jgi:tripartite ATP-independent transporter DctM subunit
MIDLSPEFLTILMLIGLLIGIFIGHHIAFVLGGVAVLVGYVGWGPAIFGLFPTRIYGVMDNYVLLAIPLFIFMAQFLDSSGITENLFTALRFLLGPIRGGIGISVVIVSTIFAACTGIIGASVVTMGLLALPMMLKYGYSKQLSSGVVCAGGTLGILIPPSIMLVVMGGQAQLSVGKLFAGAIIPGLMLSGLYIVYVGVRCFINPEYGPPVSKEERATVSHSDIFIMVCKSLLPPSILIIGVLGSLFTGIATPTEASGAGALLAFLMVVAYGKFSWEGLYQAAVRTAKASTMVLIIVVGASCFTGVFLAIGGGKVVTSFVMGLGLGKWGIFWLMMLIVFLLGMFIDWIGIVLICFPLFLPIAGNLGFDPLWFVIMMAINLQASFLTPPFGYALFYLKGINIPELGIVDIYKGIWPFIALMILGLILCVLFPQTVTYLPSVLVK